MRPAQIFVSAMARYSSEITIDYSGREINGKSIMSIMAACIRGGSEITVSCRGADEEAMLFEAASLLNGGILRGIGVSDGYGVGKAYILKNADLDYSAVRYTDAKREKARLEKAVAAFTAEAGALSEKLKTSAGAQEAGIPQGHLAILADPSVLPRIREKIDGGDTAEAAADAVCTALYKTLAGAEDEKMRLRAADILDIRNSLLRLLLGESGADIAFVPKGSILITKELTPSVMGRIKKENVTAVVSERGGRLSHAAILARALGVPAVCSVSGATRLIKNGDTLIADGFTGKVFLRPDEAAVAAHAAKRTAQLDNSNRPTVTKGGAKKAVYGNIGSVKEVQSVLQNGGDGIGLFRTEFLFMNRENAPTEEEQFQAYAAVAGAMNGREVIIRTADIGGDKAADYLKPEREENPLLGLRGIRYCLKNTALFKTQLRALLRAACCGNIKIMLPLITTVEEVKKTKALLAECAAELADEGLPCRIPPLGVMIETPSAALISDLLAREAAFFSIGTNDLAGYIMAADRGNAAVSRLCDALQPAVLRAIETVVKNAGAAGVPVGICGEAAADGRLIPLLAKRGLGSFSVSPAFIPSVRRALCECE